MPDDGINTPTRVFVVCDRRWARVEIARFKRPWIKRCEIEIHCSFPRPLLLPVDRGMTWRAVMDRNRNRRPYIVEMFCSLKCFVDFDCLIIIVIVRGPWTFL